MSTPEQAAVLSSGCADMISGMKHMFAELLTYRRGVDAGTVVDPPSVIESVIENAEIICVAIESLAAECAEFLPGYRNVIEQLRRGVAS